MRAALAVVGALLMLTACSGSTDEQPRATSSPEATTAGPTRDSAPAMLTPLIAEALAEPVPVPATDGKTHLVYEIRLTNTLSNELRLTSLTVLDSDVALLTLTGDQLAPWTRLVGTPTPTTTLGPAQSAVVWLDVALDEGAPVPPELTHAISVANPRPQLPLLPATMTVDVAPVAVQDRKPVVIEPPLRGPNWVDGDGCCGTSGHRTALNPINGQYRVAERFAIDFVQLDPGGRMLTGDVAKPESYAYFGADIHAVADGEVMSVRDGLPEQVPGADPTGLLFDQYTGNHVVQDLGDGNYALYAHIKTGSITVKPGDRLTAGQVIANVGNTGNSDAPHLHFHVMSTPDPLRSDGLPYVFTTFRLDGRIDSAQELPRLSQGEAAAMTSGFTARDETDVMPMQLDVMTYSDR